MRIQAVVLGVLIGAFARNINEIWAWIVMSLTAGVIGPAVLRLYFTWFRRLPKSACSLPG